MGEGEIKMEGVCDVEDTIYVAVGKNLEESKSVLSWALRSFCGRSICLLHVHQPIQLVSLSKLLFLWGFFFSSFFPLLLIYLISNNMSIFLCLYLENYLF